MVILLCILLTRTHSLVRLAELEALRSFYEETKGDSWELSPNAPDDHMLRPGGNTGWNFNASDPCPRVENYNQSWHGLSCVDPCDYHIDGADCRFGRITGMSLQFNNLEGTLPEVLFDKLINLSHVDLSHNRLSGTIPSTIGKLRNLM